MQALGAEEGAVEARTRVRQAEDFEEQIAITAVAADGEPLHLVLVHIGVEAQQFGDAAVEIAERIGGVLLVFERHARAARLPARAAAEVAAAVEREDRGFFERRGVVGRGGVRQVVIEHHDAALGEARAQLEVEIGFGDGAHDGHRIHLFGPRRPPVPGTWRWNAPAELAVAAPVRAAAYELGFLDGGDQLAVFEDGAGGVAEDSADAENDHRGPLALQFPETACLRARL